MYSPQGLQWSLLATLICGAAQLVEAGAQSRVISGVVRDTADRPILGVILQIPRGPTATTNDWGRFRLEVPTRTKIAIDVHRLGFTPSRYGLPEGGDTTLAMTLFPLAQMLPAVEVKDTAVDLNLRLSGFQERLGERKRGANSGYFITAEEIDRRKPRDVTDLFRTFPSINIKTTPTDEAFLFGTGLLMDPQSTPRNRVMVNCAITVYLDGQRLNRLGDGGVVAPDVNRTVTPEMIGGLEYYPSANRAPQKYQGLNGGCGVALIWTKRSP